MGGTLIALPTSIVLLAHMATTIARMQVFVQVIVLQLVASALNIAHRMDQVLVERYALMVVRTAPAQIPIQLPTLRIKPASEAMARSQIVTTKVAVHRMMLGMTLAPLLQLVLQFMSFC